MTGRIEKYLRQLRASLRTRPEETSRILAEAEDHLRESVAAGRAAGLTETEAAEAAVSSFGTVRAVARAHQTPRGQAAAALGSLVIAIWLLAGTLLAWCLPVGLVMVVMIAATRPPIWGPGRDPSPSQPAYLIVACGLLGLAMLGSYPRVRRFLRRSAAVTVDDDRR
jgi:hypothetical protein